MTSTILDHFNFSTKSNTPSKADHDDSVFQIINGVKHIFLPGDIVQQCSSIETFKSIGGLYGTLNTVQAIWLESQQPIRPDMVSDALWILSRQIPHLQFCLSRRGWTLWFKRIRHFKIDFETTTNEVMKVYQEVLDSKYNLWTGPLWKARLILPDPNINFHKNHKHTAVLIFGVQHAITDGTTNMKICREAVSILNQIFSGKSVAAKISPLSPTVDKVIDGLPPLKFLAKYFCKKFTATMIRNYYRKSSFQGAIPVPTTKDAKTKLLFDDFSKNETKNIIKMCKASNVTVHSLIVTVANFALLTIAQSKSSTNIGSKSINVCHCVNMRRYLEPEYNDTSGCHISFMEDKTRMSLADAQDFWNQVRKIHSSMKERLEVTKEPLMIVPLIQFASMILPVNCFFIKRGYKNKTNCHYVTTNMGNLKDLLPGPKEDDTVEITYMLRSVSCELAGNPFLLTFHTFRERLMISIDYYTNKINEETANEFFGTLCQYIRNIANFDTIYGLKKY